ncbi:MAG: hypothetical protein A4S12_11775 [Proteobacteria bacterium SG_bin5]|nr:copper chaperone PCu(A)C [Sphingomonas sp.]OQW39108.1 MAG: hypothetical protein A4S12_11775 [Proteobacteria bacterium SG_bin5]
MIRPLSRLAPLGAVALLAPLAGCGQPAQLSVDHAYVRLAAVKGNPSAAYFTIHGGPGATRLLSVTSPLVVKSELHASMKHDGAMTMTPEAAVDVPAKADLVFAPGGRHAMLYDVNEAVKPGGAIPLVFTFADNSRIEVSAPVIAAGAPAPKE